MTKMRAVIRSLLAVASFISECPCARSKTVDSARRWTKSGIGVAAS